LRKTEGIRLEISSGDDNHAKHLTVTIDAGAWVSVTAGGEGSPCCFLLMCDGADTEDK
jgi:hypothetical protein